MGGYVCNVAITRYATVSVTRGHDGGAVTDSGDRAIAEAAARRFRMPDAHVEVKSDFPIGAGLGGSSAVGVATVAALAMTRGERMQPSAIAELSREIEISDLGVPGGRQDHYAAAYGGALGLRFSAKGVDVKLIPLPARVKQELEKRCFIIYTGQSRISGETINAVIGAYKKRDQDVVNALQKMKRIAEQTADALAIGDVDGVGKFVGEQWTHQRSLHPAIPTPLIDEVIAKAKDAGAMGSKALGASGGGCVLVIARREKVDAVRAAIAPLGELLPFSIDENGVERCK